MMSYVYRFTLNFLYHRPYFFYSGWNKQFSSFFFSSTIIFFPFFLLHSVSLILSVWARVYVCVCVCAVLINNFNVAHRKPIKIQNKLLFWLGSRTFFFFFVCVLKAMHILPPHTLFLVWFLWEPHVDIVWMMGRVNGVYI